MVYMVHGHLKQQRSIILEFGNTLVHFFVIINDKKILTVVVFELLIIIWQQPHMERTSIERTSIETQW